MHCGWMEPREWLDADRRTGRLRPPAVIGAGIDEPGTVWAERNKNTGEAFPSVCPGWAVRQPLIVECCQAFKAFDKGAMEAFFPDVAHAVVEGVMELARAFDEYSRQRLSAGAKRAERNG